MILKISFWNPENHKKNYIRILEKESYDLYFNVNQHPISILWIKKLQQLLEKNFILETRWISFNLKRRSKHILINKLKNCINIINNSWLNKEYNYFIDPIKENYDIKEHNRIHHHFEILIGQVWNHSYWWKLVKERKDERIITVIKGINDITHELQDFNNNITTLCTSFGDNFEKDELSDEANNYFTLEENFGDVFLHYCQTGKTWLEVVVDKDKEISESNISPLRLLSGEFDIFFKDTKDYPFSIFNTFKLPYYLLKMGKNPYDKKLRLGRINVAKIIKNDNQENKEIIEKLRQNDQILSISIIDEDGMFPKNAILHREFLPYYDPY